MYTPFLAHLSRRLTRLAYSIPVVLASVRMCVHTFKHEHLCNQVTDRNQILTEASLGWEKGCKKFGPDRIRLWFPWQQIIPIGV